MVWSRFWDVAIRLQMVHQSIGLALPLIVIKVRRKMADSIHAISNAQVTIFFVMVHQSKLNFTQQLKYLPSLISLFTPWERRRTHQKPGEVTSHDITNQGWDSASTIHRNMEDWQRDGAGEGKGSLFRLTLIFWLFPTRIFYVWYRWGQGRGLIRTHRHLSIVLLICYDVKE